MLCEWAGAFLTQQVGGLAVGARMIGSRIAEQSLNAGAPSSRISPALLDLEEEAVAASSIGGQARSRPSSATST